jgi:hypothetical protein
MCDATSFGTPRSRWPDERAKVCGVDSSVSLQKLFRGRSLLERDVLPKEIAEVTNFSAGGAVLKSTGNIINVDAENV